MKANAELRRRIDAILSEMTVEEKIEFSAGDDTWHAPSLERLGVPQLMMCDGPHGLRKRVPNADGVYETVKATCFPTASALANAWDASLCEKVGAAIAEECRAEQVSMLLGPGMNIKRSPLCGRNFEYYSEDPYLAGKLAAGFIRGVQSRGVAACGKHFCVNSQETRRFSSSARVSARALHEIYLPAFETAVREGQVASIMHSYNRVNGEYVGESKTLISEFLRRRWGFDGFVVSDWNAVNNRTAAYKAGTDLEMPPTKARKAQLLADYRAGKLSEATIDASVRRMLQFIFTHLPDAEKRPFDADAHHRVAKEAAEECMVLLKNCKKVLPLRVGEPLAVIGGFAKAPRFQGGGSSHVQPTRVEDITTFLAEENHAEICFASGYDEQHETSDELIAEAVEAAKHCGRAVIFAGLPEMSETEGRDRRHMRLPEAHNALIEAVAAVCPRTVVVLFGGSPAELPWVDKVPAILHAYLCGQALGGAVARILFGRVNPSGKLAETHPLRLEDTPTYGFFPGSGDACFYGEDIYVGYRWYDTRKMEVLFPFGHGLSYTTFAYTAIEADKGRVTVTVKNTGKRRGKEVVQLYVHALPNAVTDSYLGNSSFGFARPEQELRGFSKVELAPGEEKQVTFLLDDRMFSVWDEACNDFRKIGGDYELRVGGSSRDLPLRAVMTADGSDERVPVITENTVVEDLLLDSRIPKEVAEELLTAVLPPERVATFAEAGCNLNNPCLRGRASAVLRQYIDWRGGALSYDDLHAAIDRANRRLREKK